MNMLLPKAGPRRVDRKHLEFVAAKGCLLCGKPAEVHHLLKPENSVRGTGRKAGDHDTIPLCPHHHRALHARGDEDAYFREVTGFADHGRRYAALLARVTTEKTDE